VLSREGQEILERDGKWLPLTAELAREQREKLDVIVPAFTKPGSKKAKATDNSGGL